MKARLIAFGEIEVEEERYDYDVVIDGGKVRKRKKGPSKQYREENGHTPLSLKEDIPWSGRQLIVGTGTYGRLPIMTEVQAGGGTARRQACRRADGRGVSHAAGSQTQERVRDSSHNVLDEPFRKFLSALLWNYSRSDGAN